MNREENIIKKSVCSYDNSYLIMGKKKRTQRNPSNILTSKEEKVACLYLIDSILKGVLLT